MERPPGIYTIGYETLTLDQLLVKLRENKIQTVVDVRLTPSSRRPGFSKGKLSTALAGIGIGYIHERELGNPPDNRDAFRNGSADIGRERLRARLETEGGDAINRLAHRAATERVAVLCVEAFDQRCHRQVVVDMVQERQPAISISSIW